MIILEEKKLSKKLKISVPILRQYLDGWRFTHVPKIKIWFHKNPDARKRSKTYIYKLTEDDLQNLINLRDRR